MNKRLEDKLGMVNRIREIYNNIQKVTLILIFESWRRSKTWNTRLELNLVKRVSHINLLNNERIQFETIWNQLNLHVLTFKIQIIKLTIAIGTLKSSLLNCVFFFD